LRTLKRKVPAAQWFKSSAPPVFSFCFFLLSSFLVKEIRQRKQEHPAFLGGNETEPEIETRVWRGNYQNDRPDRETGATPRASRVHHAQTPALHIMHASKPRNQVKHLHTYCLSSDGGDGCNSGTSTETKNQLE
jgi:hypothetical protein